MKRNLLRCLSLSIEFNCLSATSSREGPWCLAQAYQHRRQKIDDSAELDWLPNYCASRWDHWRINFVSCCCLHCLSMHSSHQSRPCTLGSQLSSQLKWAHKLSKRFCYLSGFVSRSAFRLPRVTSSMLSNWNSSWTWMDSPWQLKNLNWAEIFLVRFLRRAARAMLR